MFLLALAASISGRALADAMTSEAVEASVFFADDGMASIIGGDFLAF